MRKLAFFIIILIFPAILAGCSIEKNSGDYANFVRRDEGRVAGQEAVKQSDSLRIYSVYPLEISTKGKEQITIYGAGFARETKVFLQYPEMMKIEAFVFNPGYLQAWMPPFYPGHYILGVINPDGSEASWSGIFNYVEK